jgi:protein TonB
VSLTDFPDTIDLAFDETGLPDDGKHEPLFAAAARPVPVDSAEVAPLDPTRLDFGPDPPPPKRSTWRGPLGSLLLHLLPLLILVGWPGTPLEMPPPIPIQLVIQQPPPPPSPAPQPSPPAPSAKPPPGLRASDDFGQPKVEKGNASAPPAAGEPQPPLPAGQPAAAAPKPPSAPIPPTELESALQPPVPAEPEMTSEAPPPPPKPAPPKQQAAVRMPKPEGLALPLPLSPDQPREASHSAALPGPDATRDEYCVYALSLTMKHIDLLPLSLLGARHGDTSVLIRVLSDGTISSVRVARGSGYSDIDDRIAQMVVAVGRFPPLPQWITGRSMDFTFHLHFPHPAQR